MKKIEAIKRESEERIRQFATLAELGAILNSTLDPKEVRKRAMEAATRLVDCEVGSLLLVDRERDELFFEVALGEKGEAVKEIRLKIGQGIAGWVARHGEPLSIPDVEKDYRHFKKADEHSKFTTKNMLCVPVRVKGEIVGVLQAINKLGGRDFTHQDLELFCLLANQVAIAIDNARLYEELRETFLQTAEALAEAIINQCHRKYLAEAIEKRDPYTGGHTKRVLDYSLRTAKYLNLTPQEEESLKIAAILHDIGKIGIEDKILRKTERLDKIEYEIMKSHPLLGAEIMNHVKSLREVIPGMRYHHERIDGNGYPQSLKAEEIPLIAKIIAVADTYDAMTTDRPYRKALEPKSALEELKKGSDTQFDANVVEAFLKAYSNDEISPSLNTVGF